MSDAMRRHVILATVLVVAVGATIHLGRTEDIGWVLAIVIVGAHVGVASAAWVGVRRARARRQG
jgi:hypothetical protein